MDPPSLQILKTWISSIKCGKVTQLLSDESAVKELDHGCDEVILLKTFSLLTSKIFELKTKSLDTVFPDATPLHLFNLTDLFSTLYIKHKTSNCKDENYIICLHHIIDYLLKESYYESSLKLKKYIEEVSYGMYSIKDKKQKTMLLNNLYLMFWNGSIGLERKSGDSELILSLRVAAIDLLAHVDPSKLSTVSERIISTSHMYVANSVDSILSETICKVCNDILRIATPMVTSFLKSNHESDFQETSVEMTDLLVVSVKSYSEILIEVMRVHNLFSRGREGLDLCIKYCKMFIGSENVEKSFNGFLDILCDIFSQVAVASDGEVIVRKGFHAIYHKLCEIQNLSDCDTEMMSENVYCGVILKSLPFLKSSECVCRGIIDLWASNNTDSYLGICAKDESSLLLLLELGGKLNTASDSTYSLKFMAFTLKVFIHKLSSYSEDTGFGEYDHNVAKAKEILIMLMNVEEKINSIQSNSLRTTINVIIQLLPDAIQLFFKKKLFVTCEEFVMKFYKLTTKWCQEFPFLKANQWWSIKYLCMCRREQKKFRASLSALTLAIESRITEKYYLLFKEWAKVKINSQLSDEAGELKLSTVYHILKENMKGQNWYFSNEDIVQLLQLELYAYMFNEPCPNDAVQDVCHKILEISGDATLKAEAQLCLIELSYIKISSELTFGETETTFGVTVPSTSGDKTVKPNVAVDTLKSALNSCLKLAADFQKEIRNAPVPENVPAMLCVLGQSYYLMFLFKSCYNQKKAKNELSGNGPILLQAPRKIDVNGQEEELEDDLSSCDIVPSQLSLKSSKQKQLLNATLNVAIDLWEHAVEKGLKNSDCEKFNIKLILKCIETSACIYELYDDLWSSTKAWCLKCKYADIFMKDEDYLFGISNLMRKGAVSLSSESLLRVDNITAKLDKESPLFLSYLLGKCWQYLYSFEFSAGLPILGNVIKDCNPGMGKWHKIIYAQAKFLLALYCLQSPMDLMNSGLFKDPVFWGYTRYDSAISALSTMIRLLGDWKDSGSLSLYYFGQALLLDISLWIGELFLDLNMPREAYAYLKQQVVVAQKFLLPNRTVQFLTILALVDLEASNKIDCEVKLLGMESIIDFHQRKDQDLQMGDIQNLIQWLDKGKVAKNINPNTLEGVLITEDSAEVGAKAKKEMGHYSPQRPGSNYKYFQMKKCADKCFCEWCVNSGFQKAFSGLRVVHVCLANKSQDGNLSLSTEIFDNSNRILRGIISRFKIMVTRMETFYFSLLPSELGEKIDSNLDCSDFFVIEVGRLHVFYVRFMLKMANFYLQEWEDSDASRKDLIDKSGTLINVVEEETKDMKYIYGLNFLVHIISRMKFIIENARMISPVNEDETCDEYDREFRLWEKDRRYQQLISTGMGEPEVCKTPSAKVNNASESGKVGNGNGGDGIYDPIPSMQKRNLPQRNLNLNFKKVEQLSNQNQRGQTRKVAAPGLANKKVTNSDSKAGKLKEETAGGIGVKLVKRKPDNDQVQADVATGINKMCVSTNDADDQLVCNAQTRRRRNKL